MVGNTLKHTRAGGARCTGCRRWQHDSVEACGNRGVSELEVPMECEKGGKISVPLHRTSEDKVAKMGTQVVTAWWNSASGWLPVAVWRCGRHQLSGRGLRVCTTWSEHAHPGARADGKIWPGGPGRNSTGQNC
jgi:hypothetical protein